MNDLRELAARAVSLVVRATTRHARAPNQSVRAWCSAPSLVSRAKRHRSRKRRRSALGGAPARPGGPTSLPVLTRSKRPSVPRPVWITPGH